MNLRERVADLAKELQALLDAEFPPAHSKRGTTTAGEGTPSVEVTSEESRKLAYEFFHPDRWFYKSDSSQQIAALAALLESVAAKARGEALEEAAKLMDDGECLPTCNSFFHADLCPVVNSGSAIRALQP